MGAFNGAQHLAVGTLTGEVGLAAAVGVFKSLVGFGLVWLSYWLADRFANYRVF